MAWAHQLRLSQHKPTDSDYTRGQQRLMCSV